MTQNFSGRRIAITRELLTASSQSSNEQRQAFAVFSNSFRLGKPFDYLPLPGASEYERIVLTDDLQVVVKRKDDMHLLLWLGSPAAVEEWAATHKCEINPQTGVLQLYRVAASNSNPPALPAGGSANDSADVPNERANDASNDKAAGKTTDGTAKTAGKETHESSCVPAPRKGLFDALSDDELFSVGLPQDRFAQVRAVAVASDLEAIEEQLPDHVYEALTWYAQGEDWAQIKEAYAQAYGDTEAVVPTSIGSLDTGRFHIVTSDEDLRSVMDKPLAQWRVFLHPVQKRIVDKAWHGPVLVTGGAGTGKTVAAIHRARHLVRLPDWKESDRLLFTTFTKNLALDLEQLLKQICTRDEMKRIQVQNIDAWLATYIRQHGADKTIVYPGKKGGVYETAWTSAWASFDQPEGLRRTESFYRSEFEEIVLPQHCMTSRDYILADRKGRGKVLSRLQRKAIWPLFEDMRLQLQLQDAMTVEDAALFASRDIAKNHPNGLYRAVIADEIQDFKPDMLKLLRAMAVDVKKLPEPIEGDLFLAGDAHQRIYGKPVAFSACGIEIRGRSKKLRLNYRTTDEIRKVADAIYEGTPIDNMDGDVDMPTGYAALRHGAFPEAHCVKTFSEEVDWICRRVKTLMAAGYAAQEMCVVLRTNELAATYAQAVEAQGIAVHPVSRNRPDDPEIEGMRFATMHRVKGLEFKVVFIAGLEEGKFPLPAPTDDATLEKARLAQEKALFYVAASRASDLLFFTAAGNKSAWFPALHEPVET